jgi:hypothetical protein
MNGFAKPTCAAVPIEAYRWRTNSGAFADHGISSQSRHTQSVLKRGRPDELQIQPRATSSARVTAVTDDRLPLALKL